MSPDAQQTDRSLDRSFVRNVAWVAVGKWTSQAITAGITIFVARILTPDDYGLVAMSVVFMGLVRFLSDFGIGGAVLILREADEGRLAEMNSMAVLFGLAGASIAAIFAIPLGKFFDAPRLSSLILVMSSSFLISGFRTIPLATLQRDLRFKVIAAVDLTQGVLGALLTLALAMSGAGYWSLALGNLVAILLATLSFIVLSPHGFRYPRLANIRSGVAVSRDLTIAQLGWYIYSNADFFVVGKVLGQTALGLYNIGWTLSMLIVERVVSMVGSVTPPYLATVRDQPGGLRRFLYHITGALALITFPVCLGLMMVAEDFCRVILGEKWIGAIGALRVLAVYASIRALAPLLTQVLTISRQHTFVAVNNVSAAVGMPVAFWIGARWGIEGVAWAWVLAYPLVVVPVFLKVRELLDVSVGAYLNALRPALVSSLVMVAALLVIRVLAADVTPVVRLTIMVGAGALIYCSTLFVGFRRYLEALRTLIRPTQA